MLLLFISLGCEKEGPVHFETTQNTTVSYTVTSLENFKALKPIINNVKKINAKTSALNRSFEDFLPLENIDTTKVIQYTDSTGYSTYTFKIENENENSINFENLHLLETYEGYIGYILSYEPDADWYDSHLIYQHGEYVLDMSGYVGDITKYSLEREVIWTTKQEAANNGMAFRGEFITVCIYSLQRECTAGNHSNSQGWDNCTATVYNTVETCNTVWSGGGNSSGDNTGDGGSGNYGGGGNNNNDDCNTTSGTVIIDDQPLSGIEEGCTNNDNIVIDPNSTQFILAYQLSQISGEGDSFIFDSTLTQEETSTFNTVLGFEEFLEDLESSFQVDSFNFLSALDGTKITQFKGKFNLPTPVYLNIHVKSTLDDPDTLSQDEFDLIEIVSFETGITPFLEWEQDSYSHTINDNIVTAVINGHFNIGITISGFDISYSDSYTITVKFDKFTGQAISMNVLANN